MLLVLIMYLLIYGYFRWTFNALLIWRLGFAELTQSVYSKNKKINNYLGILIHIFYLLFMQLVGKGDRKGVEDTTVSKIDLKIALGIKA